MGGYASYVWPAYALTIIVLIANILFPLLCRRRILRELRQLHGLNKKNIPDECHT